KTAWLRVLTLAAVAVALISAWHTGGHAWRRLAPDPAAVAGYTAKQRPDAAIAATRLQPRGFPLYPANVQPCGRLFVPAGPAALRRVLPLSRDGRPPLPFPSAARRPDDRPRAGDRGAELSRTAQRSAVPLSEPAPARRSLDLRLPGAPGMTSHVLALAIGNALM